MTTRSHGRPADAPRHGLDVLPGVLRRPGDHGAGRHAGQRRARASWTSSRRLVGEYRPDRPGLLLGQRLAARRGGSTCCRRTRRTAWWPNVPCRRRTSRRCPTRSRSQVPIILEVLDAFGIAVRRCRRLRGRRRDRHARHRCGQPVDVVTGDRDLFQLVDDEADVRVLYIARGVGNHERVDNAWVRAKYGIDARAVRRLRDAARRRLGRAARAWRGSARRPPPRCSTGSATWPASSRRPTTPTRISVPGRAARSRPQPTTWRSRRRSSRWPETSTWTGRGWTGRSRPAILTP